MPLLDSNKIISAGPLWFHALPNSTKMPFGMIFKGVRGFAVFGPSEVATYGLDEKPWMAPYVLVLSQLSVFRSAATATGERAFGFMSYIPPQIDAICDFIKFDTWTKVHMSAISALITDIQVVNGIQMIDDGVVTNTAQLGNNHGVYIMQSGEERLPYRQGFTSSDQHYIGITKRVDFLGYLVYPKEAGTLESVFKTYMASAPRSKASARDRKWNESGLKQLNQDLGPLYTEDVLAVRCNGLSTTYPYNHNSPRIAGSLCMPIIYNGKNVIGRYLPEDTIALMDKIPLYALTGAVNVGERFFHSGAFFKAIKMAGTLENVNAEDFPAVTSERCFQVSGGAISPVFGQECGFSNSKQERLKSPPVNFYQFTKRPGNKARGITYFNPSGQKEYPANAIRTLPSIRWTKFSPKGHSRFADGFVVGDGVVSDVGFITPTGGYDLEYSGVEFNWYKGTYGNGFGRSGISPVSSTSEIAAETQIVNQYKSEAQFTGNVWNMSSPSVYGCAPLGTLHNAILIANGVLSGAGVLLNDPTQCFATIRAKAGGTAGALYEVGEGLVFDLNSYKFVRAEYEGVPQNGVIRTNTDGLSYTGLVYMTGNEGTYPI